MASTKDIIDGQRFNRQRLVTAFSSGMPEGRELTPIRPWKGVIASLVLTGLIIGGSWVSRMFAPTLPNGWDNGNLIINSTNGSRYVSIEGTLYPVRNASSAHLLFPSMKTISASDDALAKVDLGPVVGIIGAPDKVPSADKVSNASLTSCVTADSTLWTAVNKPERTKSAQGAAILVNAGEEQFLIAGDYRYTFSDTGTGSTNRRVKADNVLNAFGLRDVLPVEVPAAWSNLFRPGEPLVPLTIADAGGTQGDAARVEAEGIGTVPIGTVINVERADGTPDRYWVRADGTLQYLSPTAYTMYKMSDDGNAALEQDLSTADFARVELSSAPLRATWPQNITQIIDTTTAPPCAFLGTGSETTLASGVDVPQSAAIHPIEVASQTGALVTQSGEGTRQYYLIDEDGLSYHLSDWSTTGAAFGYSNVEPLSAQTLSAWMDLFAQEGIEPVQLSSEAAWATVPEGARKDGGDEG